MAKRICERCLKLIDGPEVCFGHDEILGQILGWTCIECAVAIVYEYKAQAETIERLEKKLDQILERLDGATLIPEETVRRVPGSRGGIVFLGRRVEPEDVIPPDSPAYRAHLEGRFTPEHPDDRGD